jgi:hypothetical protein
VQEDGSRVTLTLCDPGAKSTIEMSGASLDALEYPAIRLWLFVVGITEGLDEKEGDCFADEMLRSLPFEQLSGPDGPDFESAEVRRATDAAKQRCT